MDSLWSLLQSNIMVIILAVYLNIQWWLHKCWWKWHINLIYLAQGVGNSLLISKNPKWTYNPTPVFAGHGDKSVMMLSQVITLTEEEMLCIRFHMGAYITDDWDSFDRAIRKYQSVLFTHTADMYASKVQDRFKIRFKM